MEKNVGSCLRGERKTDCTGKEEQDYWRGPWVKVGGEKLIFGLVKAYNSNARSTETTRVEGWKVQGLAKNNRGGGRTTTRTG